MISQEVIEFPGEVITPEQRLWAAVLLQAWEDAFELSPPMLGGRKEEQEYKYTHIVREAREFFEFTGGVKNSQSLAWQHFEAVCYAAGVDPELTDIKYYDKKYNRTREAA